MNRLWRVWPTLSSIACCNDGPVPYPSGRQIMGRNLYILATTLTLFALISCGIAYTNVAQQPGSPGDVALWRTMGLVLFLIALLVALAGVLSSLFEQAERRS